MPSDKRLSGQVLSVTRFIAGDSLTAIPEIAELGGTLRAFSPDVADMAVTRMVQMVESIGNVHGCNVTVSWREDVRVTTPAVHNSPHMAAFAASVASECAPSCQSVVHF